jgi:hypothetical protein
VHARALHQADDVLPVIVHMRVWRHGVYDDMCGWFGAVKLEQGARVNHADVYNIHVDRQQMEGLLFK